MADLCIRSGATGTNDGSDWTNAFPTFPATGNFCYNNLGYDLAGVFSPNCDTEASNGVEVSDPFVSVATGDFHLTDSIPGTALGAGFSDTDPDGLTRGDGGTWDRGAFQFAGAAPGGGETASLPTLPNLPSLPRL